MSAFAVCTGINLFTFCIDIDFAKYRWRQIRLGRVCQHLDTSPSIAIFHWQKLLIKPVSRTGHRFVSHHKMSGNFIIRKSLIDHIFLKGNVVKVGYPFGVDRSVFFVSKRIFLLGVKGFGLYFKEAEAIAVLDQNIRTD